MEKKRIIPQREKCNCGRRVLNHHWLCDQCYSRRALIEKQIKVYQIKVRRTQNKIRKLREEIKKINNTKNGNNRS